MLDLSGFSSSVQKLNLHTSYNIHFRVLIPHLLVRCSVHSPVSLLKRKSLAITIFILRAHICELLFWVWISINK